MRVLMLHEDRREPGEGGGAESLLRDQTAALRALGHTVAWLHSEQIERAIDTFRPDIVHVGTVHNFIGFEPIRWLQEQHFPHVWALMDYWPFCHGRMLLIDDTDRPCAAVNAKCDGSCARGRSPSGWLSLVNGSPVVALNRYTADIYRRNGMRVDATVELGIDTELFAPDLTQRDPEASIYTSSAWAAYPAKGMRYLASAIRNTRYQVKVVTGVPRERVAEALKRAHVYVYPSVYQETFGLCLTEAMASGCACIASDVAGARAQIDDGVTGILVPPRDPGAIRAVLDRLMASPDERDALGQAARAHIEQDHTLEAMGRRWEAVYQQALGG